MGKSTLATQLAHRLGITRLIGTDMVRQTMRAFFAPELMPAIHTSSFDAAAAVRVPVPRETDLSKMGFIEQTKAVSVGIEALVQRGIDEAQRMVVEGVHLVPGFLDRSRWGEAIVLEFMLAITDKERHRGNFTVREWETGGIRPLRRYIEHFAEIRRIQKYMVGRAQALGVPVIDGPSLDDNLSEVLGMILRRVEEEGGEPEPAGAGQTPAAETSRRDAGASVRPPASDRLSVSPVRRRPQARARTTSTHASSREVTGNLLRGMTYSASGVRTDPSSNRTIHLLVRHLPSAASWYAAQTMPGVPGAHEH